MYGGIKLIMFDFIKKFEAPLAKDSLSSALSTQKYNCPFIMADINDALKTLTDQKNFDSFMSLLVTMISKEVWNTNNSSFKAGKIVYNAEANCWEFIACHKLVGEAVQQTKSLKNSNQYTKSTIFMYLSVRITVYGKLVIIQTSQTNYIDQQKYSKIVSVDGDFYNNFLIRNGTMRLNKSYCKRIETFIAQKINLLEKSLKNYSVKDGDLLWVLNTFNNQKYQNIFDYSSIQQIYNNAIKTFPLFRNESFEKQNEILRIAFKHAKESLFSEGKRYVAYSTFARELYFEIIKQHLDFKVFAGRGGIKKLKMQKWGREHFGSLGKTLLCTDEDLLNFDYSKVSIDQLVWVIYDDINYPLCEMIHKLTPPELTLKVVFDTTVNISLSANNIGDDEIEEDFF